MALTFGYFDHINHDIGYHADDINYLFNGVIIDGIFKEAAIYGEDGASKINNRFHCTFNDSNIEVDTGKALFNGIWVINNEVLTLTPDTTDYYVVIEIDKRITKREANIKLVNDTKLLNGPKIFQYALAKVSNTSDITQLVNTEYYVVTPDTKFKTDKKYYELSGSDYVLTSDTTMDSGKTYYELKDSYYVENILDLPDITIRNNLTTADVGYVLDARQGHTIIEKAPFPFAVVDGVYGYKVGNTFFPF